MKNLNARTHKVENLVPGIIEEMYNLYAQYYDAVDSTNFRQDLQRKDYVVLLKDCEEKLCGFTALQHYKTNVAGRKYQIAYSGDTVVNHHYWGDPTLSLEWCRLAGILKSVYPNDPLFWFLISKGHKTYRYLHAFAKHYYPNRAMETPAEMQTLIDHLAVEMFGDNYKREKSIVVFPASKGHLKNEWDDASQYNHNKEVDFFLRRNPSYMQGTELVCLTELSEGNFRSFGLSKFREGLHVRSMV